MGVALAELKRYEEAIQQYKLAIQYDPSNSDAFSSMGFALYDLKRYEEAMEQYKIAFQYDPSDPYNYYYKGRLLMILGRYDEAEEEYNHSIELLIPSLSSLKLEDALYQLYELNKIYFGWIKIKRRDFQSVNQIFTIELKNKLSTDTGKLIKSILLYKQGEYHSSLSLLEQVNIQEINRNILLEINYYYYMAMCLWKLMKKHQINDQMDQMNDQMDVGEKEERRRIIIMEWLNKSIEKDKEWVKAYYRRAQLLSPLQSSNGVMNVIPAAKSDFKFVIKNNQQNPPFSQLSPSKINFLKSSLRKDTKTVLCKRGVKYNVV